MKQRIHGMDALRGIAMWLGVVLHGVMAYQVSPRIGWPKDANTSIGMDVIYDYLHSFRMPLFFLVAGFFARFLSLKIGTSAFVKHRFKRILLPFLFSVILIVPLTGYAFSVYRNLNVEGNIFLAAFWSNIRWTGFYHIWFLYYLLILYGLQLVFQALFKRFTFNSKWITEGVFFLSTMLLALIQYFFYDGKVEPYTGLVPQISQICYYAYFFFAGFLINTNIDFLFRNKYLRYGYLVVGLALLPVVDQVEMDYALKSLLLSLQTNLFILGHIAIFMHLFQEQSKWLRYFSDGSYWFYLIHLPIVVGLQLLLFQFDLSPWFKATFVVVATTVISMITYDLFVRYTFIGTMLNGKKVRERK